MPESLSSDFFQLLPSQRSLVSQLLREGKIINYALSLEHARIWAVVSAGSENEVYRLLDMLPLTRFLQYEVSQLTFYHAAASEDPAFSLN
ncbi:MAG: hypothetical protein RLY31_807 [Bacteroidota bacterium]